VDVEEAIRTRRTHKVYGAEPVPRETLDELFELARWAPNHNLTNPWRFRVLGPDSLAALKQAAGPEAAAKLDRAPTLVVASQVRSDDAIQDEEDLCAVAVWPATGAPPQCCARPRAARPPAYPTGSGCSG
jgi:nitroreductase